MTSNSVPLRYRRAKEQDLPQIQALEAANYPTDEAASYEMLVYRCTRANDFFDVVEVLGDVPQETGAIIGYICGTLTKAECITHESMSVHEPQGSLLCIHSVVIDSQYRHQNIGTALLRQYLSRIRSQPSKVRGIQLIAKSALSSFYQKSGFYVRRESAIVHGADPWLEFHLAQSNLDLHE